MRKKTEHPLQVGQTKSEVSKSENEVPWLAQAAQFLFCKSGDQVWGGSAGFMLR
jgi:hypothetical protein